MAFILVYCQKTLNIECVDLGYYGPFENKEEYEEWIEQNPPHGKDWYRVEPLSR